MTEIVNSQPDMQVVGAAADPLIARDLIKSLHPDVLTLDVEMPRMDGLEFLEKLMRLRPMPVVMVSSLTERGSEIAMRALELGAVDFVTKPRLGMRDGLMHYTNEITDKIRAAACARLQPRAPHNRQRRELAVVAEPPLRRPFLSTEKLIVIGASTGGTEAIREVLEPLPADCPAIMIAQHMPAGFTKSFAHRLDGLVPHPREGSRARRAGVARVRLHRAGRLPPRARPEAGPITSRTSIRSDAVNRHRPSIDVLFDSVARNAGVNAVGVLLTGMGKDGAAGMLRMREAGAYTFAQDEASCIVFGMPREAILLGAADEVHPLDQMAGCVLAHLRTFGERANRV